MESLIKVETLTAIEVFSDGGADRIIELIEIEARAEICDISTTKGRKYIAALAHKIARSKTALDALGKDLVADWKDKAKAVDAERRLIRDRLDDLKAEIREPLTRWEYAETEKREAEHIAKLISDCWDCALIEDDMWMREREIAIKQAQVQREQEEMKAKEKAERLAYLKRAREEAAEKERQEREAEVARKAVESAKIEADQRAAMERQEAAEITALQNAETERVIAEHKAAKERAMRETIEAIKAGEERAKRERDGLIREQHERDIKHGENILRAKREDEERAADVEHQKAVHENIMNCFLTVSKKDSDRDILPRIICLIANGKVPNVTINY